MPEGVRKKVAGPEGFDGSAPPSYVGMGDGLSIRLITTPERARLLHVPNGGSNRGVSVFEVVGLGFIEIHSAIAANQDPHGAVSPFAASPGRGVGEYLVWWPGIF